MKEQNKIFIKENWAEILVESPKYGNKIIKIDLEDVEKFKDKRVFISNEGYKEDLFYAEMYLKDNSNKKVRLHRYLMNCPKNLVVDHINFDTLDNRKSNLRVVTNEFNSSHKDLMKSNGITKYRHIHFDRNCYRVSICRKRKRIFDKRCKTLEEAIKERNKAYEDLY